MQIVLFASAVSLASMRSSFLSLSVMIKPSYGIVRRTLVRYIVWKIDSLSVYSESILE